jgi:hypothetical protein
VPAFYALTYQPDGRVERFAGSRGNYYEWTDGTRLEMDTTPAWCHACAAVRHGEQLQTVEELDQQIAALHDPRSELYRSRAKDYNGEHKDLGEAFARRYRAPLEQRRVWRAARASPPRCTACGSTDLYIYPLDVTVPNPAGEGSVTVRVLGMCSTDFNEWFFTPEGDRIPQDTKPTYWRHVSELVRPRFARRLLRLWFGRAARRRKG